MTSKIKNYSSMLTVFDTLNTIGWRMPMQRPAAAMPPPIIRNVRIKLPVRSTISPAKYIQLKILLSLGPALEYINPLSHIGHYSVRMAKISILK